jgi:hypothetical protein
MTGSNSAKGPVRHGDVSEELSTIDDEEDKEEYGSRKMITAGGTALGALGSRLAASKRYIQYMHHHRQKAAQKKPKHAGWIILPTSPFR